METTTLAPVIKEKKRRSPSLKRAATRAQKEVSRGFPLPLILTCPITNKSNKYTSLPYIRKLLQKYGDIEKLKQNYISSEGKKLQKNKSID